MRVFYAAKGGSGCSVVAAATALLSSRRRPTLIVDLIGDQPAILGVSTDAPGLDDWEQAASPLPDALRRIETVVDDSLSLVAPRRDPLSAGKDSLTVLSQLLASDERQVIIDVGTRWDAAAPLFAASERITLVTRACYLALRAAQRACPADDVVLVNEPGRSLRSHDVAAATSAVVQAEVRWDPAVARAVDAGLLAARLPRSLRQLDDSASA